MTLETLRGIARDRLELARLRAEAIVALGGAAVETLAPQLDDADASVRTQAARTLPRTPAAGLQGHWRTGGAATIVLLVGEEKRIEADQVVSFRAMGSSLMPEGLAAIFSVEELRDLVAYLEALK